MASTYKTPGVYVREISKFPPSVAQVETAIPAFIGYTKKAQKITNGDLRNKPTRITSVLDYVRFFGDAPDVTVDSIDLNALNQVSSVDIKDKYYMYEAIRLFYANGGGPCYVVSVGNYGDTIQNGNGVDTSGLLMGLSAIKKQDEPTILLAPDAAMMNQSAMNDLHTAMLRQCNDLQDRFCIFDLKENQAKSYSEIVDDFRNGIGMNFLKYGAAYSPWLKTNLPRQVNYKDIKGKIKSNGADVTLSSLVKDNAAKSLANELDNLIDDQIAINNALNAIKTNNFTSLENRFESLANTLRLNTSRTNLQHLLNFYLEVIDMISDTIDKGTLNNITLKHKGLDGFLFESLEANLEDSIDSGSIHQIIEELRKMIADSENGLGSTITLNSSSGINLAVDPSDSPTDYFTDGEDEIALISPHIADIASHWAILRSSIDFIRDTVDNMVKTRQEAAIESIPALKNIYVAIANEYLTLPPSAAIAGVYATVDSTRGVWKAPANHTLNNVVDVTTLIDRDIQDGLNIDTVAGKSINAIRPFTGKGIMVWGARTLAGNDNEWRYVPVRRFFNMAEESIKKATEQFVFEPNDANTWVKVRAMIENFLILQWRAGALAGATPDHAFYVKIGLGQTMTPEDVLNGYMIVEIGLAVVRPAEFIVLNFSHKMQES
ncbi:phage tail sheath family protein [Belliella kenyensis]|uniref:Phage tail sheath family protein n=1 Tax=Belliella kenyensis TaxID=1472724 RepID=A0ABV8EIZ1_9BACT|nr:phage tail sheath C-terminal domain-containing protein [Belliella kenyensis]MCH7400374.1 phage tail sheath subtilisin-like domain-containing protein [Belliella kenyensis]MDN3604608.1 phage tail sheath subtilisin-like domain-containing protein [Belliella kenyensis]